MASKVDCSLGKLSSRVRPCALATVLYSNGRFDRAPTWTVSPMLANGDDTSRCSVNEKLNLNPRVEFHERRAGEKREREREVTHADLLFSENAPDPVASLESLYSVVKSARAAI